MKKRKSGFTLIELLAVIVILAIIALISTPIIIGVIEKARKKAFEDSAYGILDAGKTYFVDKLADMNKFEGAVFEFPEGGDLKVSGSKPAGGSLLLDTNGKQALAIYDIDKKWCAYKELEEEKVTIKDYKEEECQMPIIIIGAAKTITDKNVPGNTEGLFADDFGNIRYRGNDTVVKNYVTFNNEVWRIIGVFDGRVKLIRNERIQNLKEESHTSYDFYWDTGNTNNWNTSDLQLYLNEKYWDSLLDDSKKMIGNMKYFLGGIQNTSIDKKAVYELERGTIVFNGRPTEWTGKIGLMYASDYGYAADKECQEDLVNYTNAMCKNSNWILRTSYNQHTLTPSSISGNVVIYVGGLGDSKGYPSSLVAMGVHPTLYLKQTVKITSGDGTISNPYQLSL